MPGHNFALLSPTDFEELCRDLLQRKLGVDLQAFTKGRDGGIDLRHAPVLGCNWIVQCKHYSGSSFSTLKSKLKNEELPKLSKLKPDRYILATSLGLTPPRVDELFELLKPHCKSTHDIVSKDDLDGQLRDSPDIEQSHFKLWVTSEPILSRIIHNDLFVQSILTKDEVSKRAALYVQTDALTNARKRLIRDRVCILSGVPGVGKTTLAEMLLLDYLAKDWQLVSLHQNVSEGLRAYQQNPKAKQVFYYDDFLGQISSGEKLAKNEDRVLLKLMKSVQATPRKRFVLTTREYILAQAKAEHERLANSEIDLYRFVVNCDDYGDYEKAKILANHLYFHGVPRGHIESLIDGAKFRKIIKHKNYSPRIVEWLTGQAETSSCKPSGYLAHFVSKLDNPAKLWNHAFNRQLSESSRHLLFVFATIGDAAFGHELEQVFERFYSQQSSRLHIARTSNDFRSSLNELEGAFIRIHADSGERVIQFHNPSILDFLKSELRTKATEIRALLQTAIDFIQVQRLALVFELGYQPNKRANSIRLAADDAEVLATSLEQTIDLPTVGAERHAFLGKSWVRVRHDRWKRLRDCIQIGNSFASESLQERILALIALKIDEYSVDSGGELAEILGVIEKVKGAHWCQEDEANRLNSVAKILLLDRVKELEEPLDGLATLSDWLEGNTGLFEPPESKDLLDSISSAVSNEVDNEISEQDPQRLGGDLESVEQISRSTGLDFSFEEQRLEEAIAECGPPPDEETPDDWTQSANSSSSEADIDSLFDALIQ